jgi:hypothetical protein
MHPSVKNRKAQGFFLVNDGDFVRMLSCRLIEQLRGEKSY